MDISLALDIDGVLANSLDLYRSIAIKEGVEGKWWNSYNGMFKVKTRDGKNFGQTLFGDKYRESIVLDPYPVDKANEGYNKFINNDLIDVRLVTSRDQSTKENTKYWLSKHGFDGYEELLFLNDKTKAPSNVIIDDHIKNVKSYLDNARMGIIMDAPYNQNFDRGTRVKNLKEAYYNLLKFL